MRRTSTRFALRCFWLLLLCLGLGVSPSRAQSDQGLVADSTELRVLRQLYYATGGPQWNHHDGWPATPADWASATLGQAASWYGVELGGGDVAKVYWEGNHLQGPLPASVGLLRGLLVFDCYYNQLSGAIPPELGQLDHLQILHLGINQFSGPIPAQLGQLDQLQLLFLFYNQLSGAIPPALGQLTNLAQLSLTDNQLSGPIPAELGQLTHLQLLYLHANTLSGAIPAELGNARALQQLSLRYNQLTGPLPASLGQLAQLQFVNLSDNQLTGSLPASLGQLPQLAHLEAANNQLTGPLPDSLGRLRSLNYLDLSGNHLSGSLPASLGQLSSLYLLSLNNNQLTGAIPASLGQLSGLQQLNLFNNQLTGPLPASLGQLDGLQCLNLFNNQLSGPIPSTLGQLHSLVYCNLFNNQLTGAIPPALGGLTQVQDLNLFANQLTGPVPAELSQLRHLQYLNLNNNHLYGNLGPALNGLGYLQHLRLHDNDFTFGDLEPLFTGTNQPTRAGLFLYAPQLPPSGADTLRVNEGSPLRLASPLGGTRTHAQWQRLVSGQWQDIPGAQDSVLVWAAARPADEGSYRVRATNDWVTDLALTSRPRYVWVQPAVTGPRNLPDDTNQGLAVLRPHRQPADSAAAPPADLNYVRTWVPRVALTDGYTGSPAQPGPVRWDQWLNLPGYDIYTLPLTKPADVQRWLPNLEGPTNLGDSYGARLSAYLVAPQTGQYSFWVAGDDVCELWLSPDTDPTHSQRVAYSYHYTAQRQWRRDSTQHSAPVNLVAGQRYYVEVRHKQGGGDNFVAAAWTLPDGSFEGPIAGTHLAATAHDEPAWTVEQASKTTQYLDGLGRPVQTVMHQATAQRRDLVQVQAYDELGREPRAYLPYADSARLDLLGYHPQPLAHQQAFYLPSGQTGPPRADDPTRGVARTGVAYAETQFEASPLQRVTAQGSPGEAWQLTGGHISERVERPNTAQDSVLYFKPGYDPTSVDPGYQGFYQPGELWGVLVHDPHGPAEVGAHGYQTIEWKDKLGQVVLRQVEAGRAGRNDTSRWLRTSYVYDDFGHLRFVLQPEASRRVLALGDHAGGLPAAASPFVFHYRYDSRGRQIAKQVPGQTGETLVVYDQLDRPVLSQDAQQRTRQEWSWSKYDALGRITLSGLTTRQDTLGQVSLQNLAAADTASSHQYEQRTATLASYPQGVTTDQSFPKLGQQGFSAGQVLNVTYYDDYDFDNDSQPDLGYDTSTDGQFATGPLPVADALRTQGLTTRTKSRVLGVAENDPQQAAWLVTTTFYDERARPVQVQTSNARRDTGSGQPFRDILTTQLDFTGKVVQSVAVHEGPRHEPLVISEFFTYDHTGRLLSTRQQLPGERTPARLDSVQYNEIGQATRKTLAAGRLRQEADYTYNIRGWLTRVNDPAQPDPADLFNLSLHYEAGFTKGFEQYNGNLTGQTWRGRDGVQRAYGYAYDPLNRLVQGDFGARAGGRAGTLATAAPWDQEQDHYRLSAVGYDDNGNLLTLRRQGLLQNATHQRAKQYGLVDDLVYAYQGNRLQAVDDQVTDNQLPRPANYHGAPTSLAGDFQEQGVHQLREYTYDANGNLTADQNKGITGIAYNHLNLPRQIHFGQVGDSVVFRYAASGQKVAKLVYQTGKPLLRTDYLGPYQYEQDSLKFFPHAEGRVLRFVSYDPAGQATVRYQREFTFKDHLGNLRLAYRAGQRRTYLATLEQDAATRRRETQQFDSLSVSPPIAQATVYSYAGGGYAAQLNAGNNVPLGPLTQLAVQRGDTLRVSVAGLYPQKVGSGNFAFSLLSFVANLLQPPPAGTPAGVDGSRRGGLPLLQLGLSAGIASVPQLSGGVPKGYLRVLIFNQDSALVRQRTWQLSQNALGNFELLGDTVQVSQDGYVTVYVGNESNADVFFDNLQVEHRQGLQVQENEYDPYGLDLAGVSGAAPGLRLKNYYQFNGKENQLELGLNWNHHDWRFFDYQLGRWHSVDPLIEEGQEHWTPYQFGFDNAVRYNDPDGQFPPLLISGAVGAVVGAVVGAGIEAGTQMYQNGGHVSDWHAVGGAALQGGVTGGLAGLTGGTSLLRSGAVGAVSNVAGGIARNVYDGKPVTVGSVAKDAAVGAAIGVAGHVAGKAVGAIVNRVKGGAAAVEAEAGAGARAAHAPCGCFTAGTAVSLRRGRKPIEQVQVGDSVWAYNEHTHATALRPVTHIYRHERDTVYVLHPATGEALRTTSDHPFFVRGRWVRVRRLRVGDSLVTQAGQRLRLLRIEVKPEHVTVFNFTVDELHTYFVGQSAILVHNNGPCDILVRRGKSIESTGRLTKQAAIAEEAGFGHGVSVTSPEGNVKLANRLGQDPADAVSATRGKINEAGFKLNHTPTRNDPTHHTLILPKPVTTQVAKDFNTLFGRTK